ncbi:MAG: cobalamin-binding protein [Verrucomicrobiota bacterium]
MFKKHRVISLLPSCTEIVCALGEGDKLVGRSHECDYPPSVRRLPVCTEAKVNSAASSGEIDQQVKSLLENALSLYRVDVEKLKALKPDLILTQAQCEVCAVSLSDVERALGEWVGSKPQVISLSPQRLAQVWDDIRRVAEALGLEDNGKSVLKELKNRCVDVIEKACPAGHRPSVACIEWLDPLMAAGNWVPEMVELAGGLNLFGEPGKHSPWLNWEAVQEHDPEIIIVMPCGFDIARTLRELPAVVQRPDWAKLRAVRNGHVHIVDGNQYFNRPGPRLVDSLEILAEIIHPNLFPAKYEGKAWERLPAPKPEA